MESTLWLLEGTINTHKPFLLQPPKPPSRFSSFSAIAISTWPLRNIFAKRIGTMWTVVIFWLSNLMRQLLVWEQTARLALFYRIQVNSVICHSLILARCSILKVTWSLRCFQKDLPGRLSKYAQIKKTKIMNFAATVLYFLRNDFKKKAK